MAPKNDPTPEEVNAIQLWKETGWVLEYDDFDEGK